MTCDNGSDGNLNPDGQEAMTTDKTDGPERLYTMKETCERTGMSYEALKFYCNEGLVPGLGRDEHNHRVFTRRNITWLQGLGCLRRCGMGIKEMRRYKDLCLEGQASIPERKRMLDAKREELQAKLKETVDSIAYIDDKQRFYDGVLAGRTQYHSNLLPDPQNKN